jgi:hypothetical protein
MCGHVFCNRQVNFLGNMCSLTDLSSIIGASWMQ